MKTALRVFLLLSGIALFAYLIHQAGPTAIAGQLKELGFWLPIVLIPYAISYSLDTLGWRVTLLTHQKTFTFKDLFLIRLAGEAINHLTPSAYLGGEPVKAYLLKRGNIPLSEGMASVLIAKTTLTLAQALFILMAIPPAYPRLSGREGMLAATVVTTLFGLLVVLGAMWVQRQGLMAFVLKASRWIPGLSGIILKREAGLLRMDGTLQRFYAHHPRAFLASTGLFLLGWIAGAFEVYFLLTLLDLPVGVGEALIIEALVSLIRALFFFLPAGLGAQEGGNVFLFLLFGLPADAAMSYSIVRRVRELLLIGVGLWVLAKHELSPSSLKKPDWAVPVPGEMDS